MNKSAFTRKRLLGVGLRPGIFASALILVSLAASLSFVHSVGAAGRTTANNVAEQEARDACSGTSIRGAIWLNGSSSSYYSLGVNVAYGDTNVPVKIRGSANRCGWGSGTDIKIYATSVKSKSSRLGGLASTKLDRGWIKGDKYTFSDQGGSINATLNVSGLAAGGGTQTINITIYRCFGATDVNGVDYGSSGCYDQTIPIKVTRNSPPPPSWTVSATTTVNGTAGNINVYPYYPVTWSHTAKNNGPDSTTQAVQFSEREDGIATPLQTTSRSSGWAKNATLTRASTWTPSPSDMGKTVCRYLQFQPQTQGGGTGSSTKRCATVTERTTGNFGSWVEYGILARGNNERTSSAFPDYRETPAGEELTFKNTPTPIGNFGTLSGTALISNFLPVPSDAKTNCASLGVNDSGYYNCSGDVPLNAGTVGASLVIRTDGIVTISGDKILQPNGPYPSAGAIPQLVIIANKIDISHTVERVDAWLIANEINTCSTGHSSTNVSSNQCNKQLRINGPVKTNKLRLWRTFGGDKDTPGLAAEEFNLRPDAYLWLYNRMAGGGTKIRTTSIVELPPRY